MAVDIRSPLERGIDYAKFSPLDLVRSGISLKRRETVLLRDIRQDSSMVDEAHAQALATSMSEQHGQVLPIATRATEDSGRVVHYIIDGYHRDAGRRLMGVDGIDAVVMYGCSDEEFYDLRIIAAGNVKSVQYPRYGKWVLAAFASSKWATRGLSAVQLYGLAFNDRETSYLGVDEQELAEIKAWVRGKAKLWNRKISTTYSILKVVASADPEIVEQVRNYSGGRSLTTSITPVRIAAVVPRFPGPEYFEAQRVILDRVLELGLRTNQTTALLEKITGLIRPNMGVEAMRSILLGITVEDINRLVITRRPGIAKALEDDSESDYTGRLEELTNKLAKLEYAREIDQYRLREAKGLEDKIRELRDLLDVAQAALKEQKRVDPNEAYWWRNAPYLSALQRLCMEKFVYPDGSLEKLTRTTGLSIRDFGIEVRRAIYTRAREVKRKEVPSAPPLELTESVASEPQVPK